MPNIPRRKICEKMFDYEEEMLKLQFIKSDLQIFEKKKEELPKILKLMEEVCIQIKAQFIIFLEHKKFETEEKFKDYEKKLILNSNQTEKTLFENKNIRDEFRNSILKINKIFENNNSQNSNNNNKISLEELNKIYEDLDVFNSQIPKVLTLRRDKML